MRGHRRQAIESGEPVRRRESRQVSWLWSTIEQRLLESFRETDGMAARIAACEEAVRRRTTTVSRAAEELLDVWRGERDAP